MNATATHDGSGSGDPNDEEATHTGGGGSGVHTTNDDVIDDWNDDDVDDDDACFALCHEEEDSGNRGGEFLARKNESGETPMLFQQYWEILSTDREFLLRCALTHDWVQVERFCDFLQYCYCATERATNNNHNRPSHRQNRKLLCCVDQLLACDQYGNSVLQACCYYRPPVTAVRAILAAAQTVGCRSRAALIRHRALDQSTALQVACATGSTVAVIEALLLVTTTPNSVPAVAASPNNKRQQQAQHAIHNHYNNCFDSEAGMLVVAADQQGATPLSDLVVQYTLQRQAPEFVNRSKPLEYVTNVEAECRDSLFFCVFWSKVKLLLTAAWSAVVMRDSVEFDWYAGKVFDDGDASQTISVLHQAAAIAGTVPNLLTDLLLRCFSDQVDAGIDSCRQKKNTNGSHCTLPLHYLLLSIGTVTGDSPSALRCQEAYFLKQLLMKCVESATIPFGIPSPKSPLVQALLHGCRWHGIRIADGHTILVLPGSLSLAYVGAVQRIVRLAPNAVCQRDGDTGLFPWHVAALAANQRMSSTPKDHLQQLETIYHLLRLYPQSILR